MVKMILWFTSLAIFISCSNQNSPKILSTPLKTVVTGKVINPISDQPNIILAINRVGFEQEEIEVPLDSLGYFKIEFSTYIPVDAWVSYRLNFLILLEPGDSLHIEFDASQQDRPEILEVIQFTGTSAENNRLVAIFQKLYFKSHLYIYGHDEPYNRVESAYKNLSPDKFKVFADSIKQEEDTFLDSFIQQYKPNKFVKSWATFFIYQPYFDIITSYPIRYRKANMLKQNEWNVPISYYEYLNEHTYDIKKGLHSSYAICSYIDKYRSSIYATVREKLKGYAPGRIDAIWDSVKLNTIVANTNSIALRELVLTYEMSLFLMDKDIETFEKYNYYIDENIRSAHLREPLLQDYYATKKKIENQKKNDYNVIESLDELMSGIVSNNKGKVIYVDIWATWCGPCREEFPYARKLQQGFLPDKIAFVYICIESKHNAYENMLKEFQLNGLHYFLNKDQSTILREKLGIDGIPHYLLINKNGELMASTSVIRPSEDKTKSEIEKLIVE